MYGKKVRKALWDYLIYEGNNCSFASFIKSEEKQNHILLFQ